MKNGLTTKFRTMPRLLNKIFLVCSFWFLACQGLFSQTKKSENDFLMEQNFREERFHSKRKVTFLLSSRKNPLIKYNPISLTFGGLLFVYQKFLSKQISSNCPYNPSCSSFSKNSILRFGFIKGIALSADRLMRCNTLAAHDISFLDFKDSKIDDSPEKYRFKK